MTAAESSDVGVTSVTLTLPYLVAGRDIAAGAVRKLGVITGVDVTVEARPLSGGTSSFAAQLVESILVDGQAAHLSLIGGPDEFVAAMQTTAASFGVSDRFTYVEPTPAIALGSSLRRR